MTDPEFDEFAALWNEHEAEGPAAFQTMARKARRKGRLLAYADIAIAVLIIAPLATLFMTPNPAMVAPAIFVIVSTVWLSLVRRRFHQMAANLNTSTPAAFFDSSVRMAAANIGRVNLSLMLALPILTAAVFFKGYQHSGGRIDRLPEGIWEWATSVRGLISLAIALMIIATTVRSRRRLRSEIRRLEELRRDYEEERQRDEGP